eukprot:gb/GEZN01003816.1/.p1 GENE.gb/GEZN01003816.1/~~gb/GEZN01003816.1/.p1  ORF type:complete len:646 (+),score=133.24 gb/GEZN01003816.1/:24-1940(+)
MAEEAPPKKKVSKKKLRSSAKEFVPTFGAAAPAGSPPSSDLSSHSPLSSPAPTDTADSSPALPVQDSLDSQAPADVDSWEDVPSQQPEEAKEPLATADTGDMKEKTEETEEAEGAEEAVAANEEAALSEEPPPETSPSPTPSPTPAAAKPAAAVAAKKGKGTKKGAKKEAKKKGSKKGAKPSAKSIWGHLPQVPPFEVHDTREHLNIVFIGHVDSGKSTISGQILLLTGHVDERTIAKYEKEAQEKNRESWYLAYIMDTAEEERQKGKTVEVGRAHFETARKRYTLLDAPGHKNYVPNMIGGAAQADIGVLVISAREGEFEAGFDRGGQTREHAMLAKTLGIQRLVVMINKMDTQADADGFWGKERYAQVETKLAPFLRKCGFKKEDISWIPVSGLKGINLKDKTDVKCSWYKGPCFMDLLDSLPSIDRDKNAPLRIPILARYKDMGNLCVLGKVESGQIVKSEDLVLMPTQKDCKCVGLAIEEKAVEGALPGENIIMMLKGVEEEDVQSGYVLSYKNHVTKRARVLTVQLQILELLPHKPLLSAGYSCILHIHTAQVDCVVHKLLTLIDQKTGTSTRLPRYVKAEGACTAYIRMEESVACEAFTDFPQLGRFTLRDEGQTIAIGKIIKVHEKKVAEA